MATSADGPRSGSEESRSSGRDNAATTILTWTSEQLLAGANEARIIHGNEVYRLLRTRNQKLILVK